MAGQRERAQSRLNEGLSGADAAVIELASPLVPEGEYLSLLVEVAPQLVYPAGEGDYFSDEQVRTFRISGGRVLAGHSPTRPGRAIRVRHQC